MIEVTNDAALLELCQAIKGQPLVTFDTEFIREKTYFPVLGLVQISWIGQAPILVDPLTINDWKPWHTVLCDPEIVKVFHAGRQDLEIFFHQMQCMPENLFDTQIAASMCGYGDQVSYSALVSKVCGRELTKGNSYTDWLKRPLSENQLRYARDDVAYLPDMYEKLCQRSDRQGRKQAVFEEMKVQFHERLFSPAPESLWRKIKRAGSLKPRDLVVLQALAVWRDRQARKFDRPVRYILSDEVLVEVSKLSKLSINDLRTRRGVHPKFLDRHGQAVVEVHTEARAKPKSEWPRAKQVDHVPSDKAEALADLAWILIKEIASDAKMAPNNIILKRDLAPFIQAYIDGQELSRFRIHSGWRKDMVGEQLVKLIEGRLIIKIQRHRIVWQDVDSAS